MRVVLRCEPLVDVGPVLCWVAAVSLEFEFGEIEVREREGTFKDLLAGGGGREDCGGGP